MKTCKRCEKTKENEINTGSRKPRKMKYTGSSSEKVAYEVGWHLGAYLSNREIVERVCARQRREQCAERWEEHGVQLVEGCVHRWRPISLSLRLLRRHFLLLRAQRAWWLRCGRLRGHLRCGRLRGHLRCRRLRGHLRCGRLRGWLGGWGHLGAGGGLGCRRRTGSIGCPLRVGVGRWGWRDPSKAIHQFHARSILTNHLPLHHRLHKVDRQFLVLHLRL